MVVGAFRLAALFVNGAVRRSPHVRWAGAFLSCFVWLTLSFAMFLAEVVSIAVVIYPWLLMAESYNVYRAAQDARASDFKAKAARGTLVDAAGT